jgi:sulfur carrier protein ThiS
LRLVDLHGVTKFLVLLDITQEELKVALETLLVLLARQHVALFLGHTLELPVPLLASGLLAARVVLLDQNHIWDCSLVGLAVLNLFKLVVVELGSCEKVTHDAVTGVQKSTEMGTAEVCCVVHTKVSGTGNSAVSENHTSFCGSSDLNIHDDELDELRDISDRGERSAPVDRCGDFGGLKSVGVEQVNGGTDTVAESEREHVSDLLGELDGKCDQVVLANGHNFAREGKLVRLLRSVNVHRNQLLRLLALHRHDTAQEIDKLLGMVSRREEEIDTVMNFLDVDCVTVSTVLEDKLLEVEESTLVGDLLANLDDGAPCVVCETFLTIGALLVGLDELDFEGLLQNGALEGFLLNGDLQLDTTRMGFGPDEGSVDDTDFVQTTEFAKTESQEFTGFGLGDEPLVGR